MARCCHEKPLFAHISLNSNSVVGLHREVAGAVEQLQVAGVVQRVAVAEVEVHAAEAAAADDLAGLVPNVVL